jgi:quinoprotein glucose dehydrogenase
MTRLSRSAALAAVLVFGLGRAVPPQDPRRDDQWPSYGGDPGGTRYSTLQQITRDNVSQLQVAWTYRTGELGQEARDGADLTFEATPIHFDGRLYLGTAFGKVIALDPATGKELWTHDPNIDRSRSYSEVTSRGVSAWRDPDQRADSPCAARIFAGTIDARLLSLDARTGMPCRDFGKGGTVDLAAGVDEHSPGDYQVTSPPAIHRGLVIVGSSIGDNFNVDTGSGVVRAFAARTGELRWSWRPVVPADGSRMGAANAWSMMAVDAERDLVFIPTSSPSPDFYGGLRPGDNRDANSIVALRGSTGERVWAFQTVRHDLWDYDLAAQPAVVTIRRDGRSVAAVAQATKMGLLFVLDRDGGVPLFPIEERPVPKGDMPGDTSAATQPFPVKPRSLMPLNALGPAAAWGLTEADRDDCRKLLGRYRSQGIYTPPSLQGTLMYPGNASGTNWGSVAYDPERQLVVLNTSRLVTLVQLIPREDEARIRAESKASGEDWEIGTQRGAPYLMRRRTLLNSRGLPCTAPPWGTLAAVDLAGGDVKWEVPLGRGLVKEHPLAALVADIDGVPNTGGPLATAAGLVFIGATMDGRFRAFDTETGRELWSTQLPRAGMATPMTYRAPDGRQMVVIAAGGHGKVGMPLGDYVVAYALPAQQRR